MDAALEIWPDMAFGARANRPLLGRAVRHLVVNAGIRQFLDIGTGIPTAGNTHEVAQAVAPESRVVYVDYDLVVLAHARALLDSSEYLHQGDVTVALPPNDGSTASSEGSPQRWALKPGHLARHLPGGCNGGGESE